MSMTTTLATWRCHGVGLVRGPIALMTRQPLSCRRSRRVHVRAEQDKNANDNPDNSNDPDVMGDWRSFRASLIAAEQAQEHGPKTCWENMQLLRVQSERLAQEEIWCHPTATVEVGGLLIATPNAHRILENEAAWQVVIFIIRHDEDGTIGVVLNRPTALTMGPQSDGGIPLDVEGLSDSARNCFSNLRIYMGGPQAQTAIHVLHMHGYLEGAAEIVPGIYAGGTKAASEEIMWGRIKDLDFRFFAGVHAWRPGQLQQEMDQGAWYSAACSRNIVLKQCLGLPTPLWREVMNLMGGEHSSIANQVYGEFD